MRSFIKGGLFGGGLILFSFLFSYTLWDNCSLDFCTNYIRYQNPIIDPIIKGIFYVGFVIGFLLTLPGRLLILFAIPGINLSIESSFDLMDHNLIAWLNFRGWLFMFILYFVIGGLIGLLLRKRKPTIENKVDTKNDDDIKEIIDNFK